MSIDFRLLWANAITWIVANGLKVGFQVVLIAALMYFGVKFSDRLAKRLFAIRRRQADEEFKKRAETLAGVVSYILSATILVIGSIMILNQFVKIGPILAAAGVVGVAIGFGAQHLVQDIISGFFILLDDQIRVGDVVQIADKGGLVERMNLRMVVLRDLAGNVHYVRNGKIDVVTNMTKDYSRYVFDIGVAYREDVDEVVKVVRQVDEELRSDPAFSADILEPIEILGLDQFGDSAVIIKARTKTKPIKQWSVGREFNRRLKKRFDELNIEIPFPHVTLYMGQDKTGQAPALNVAMDANASARGPLKG